MERLTRQRQAVLDAIDQAGRALTPGEILDLAQHTVATLNLSTIYRQLNALQDEARIFEVATAAHKTVLQQLLGGLGFEALARLGAIGKALGALRGG